MHGKLIIRWRPLVLVGLALLGLALRLYGLNWDQGQSFHPDERQILFHVTTLAWPSSLAQFLNQSTSPLNPHFFAYGSFPLYLLALLGHLLIQSPSPTDAFVQYTLLGRVLSAIFDSGTILLTGLLALLLVRDEQPGRAHAWNVALLAAALVAFTPLQLQLAHFYAVDTILLFFVMLTILASVALVESEKLMRWSLVAGIAYGLALATKFSAAPLVVPFCVALLLRWYRQRDLFEVIITLIFTACITFLAFLIAQPYALLDLGEFVQQVAEQGNLARGLLDYPYVRQFVGTTPYLYEMRDMLFWGLGLMLGCSAFVALLWFCWRTWRRNAGPWLILLSWVLVYGAITGSFFVKYMRYMLPLYPFLTLMAAAALLTLTRRDARPIQWLSRFAPSAPDKLKRAFPPAIRAALLIIVLGGTIFQGLALLNIYSQPNTRIQASLWLYHHLPQGSVLTFEQWDDPLPVAVDGYDPSMFTQASYTDTNGQTAQGLDLYSDDTTEKAQVLAKLLPTLNAITMSSDRLDKSIPRLPARYPLTIHYYQLLFSGQLGFHLAAEFQNHPNLLGITLDDSNADESFSVFDHPHARIFVRDSPYPYTSDQLYQKLMQGVQLPAPAAQLPATQRTLLLSPQQIDDNQSSPPFAQQFPANSLSNQFPILFWWLALLFLGLLTYPLLFPIMRRLADRGYIFSKLFGLLLLAYLSWLLATLHLLPFSRLSLLLVMGLFALLGATALLKQRHAIFPFVSRYRYKLLLAEVMFTLAYLLFVGIRSLNPDLWNIYLGGEKPMELAFLNAILRSPYMPPLDPWFSGGYINYYYFGYVIVASLIKLTSIIPTTAFNLAIPTLFALTFSGVVVIVYSLARSLPFALLGGYFAAFIGNFNGLVQLKGQVLSLLAHIPPPDFDYWQSSRVIPFTINEFPFWSFLFADLHPHVINMPITVGMLTILAALLLSTRGQDAASVTSGERIGLYLCAAFLFGTLTCVNPWDMPVYALLLAAVLLVQTFWECARRSKVELVIALAFRLVLIVAICALGYLFYWPFYRSYQQLYVNGLGQVKQGTTPLDYLTVFGLWTFIALSFFLAECYYRRKLFPGWRLPRPAGGPFSPASTLISRCAALSRTLSSSWRATLYCTLSSLVLIGLLLISVKVFLAASLLLGAWLFVPYILHPPHPQFSRDQQVSNLPMSISPEKKGEHRPALAYTYILLLMGLAICLGIELVYVRDFLDGGDYERMNTVFKFSISAWFCLAIGCALAVQRLWHLLTGLVRRLWLVLLLLLVLGSSLFLSEGTLSRVHDHQLWTEVQKPAVSASYTPSLDGFAFVRSWYPGDAAAIEWLNAHVSGSPVILEAAAPVSYQWYNRVSVFTGLPDVLGWPDHVGEQRYSSQPLNRITDIAEIYSTTDPNEALVLLHYYHVRYIYVGSLERQLYEQQSTAGLDKFDHMVGQNLRIAYRSNDVTIYEVLS